MADSLTLENEITQLRRQLARGQALRERAEVVAERRLRQLHFRQQAAELIEIVVSVAYGAASVEDALRLTVKGIGKYLHCAAGHLFVADRGDSTKPVSLESSTIWYCAEPARIAPFQIATTQATDACLRNGLPGRALRHRKPVWMTDIASQKRFVRAQAAQAAGFRTAFVFPVLEHGKVTALLEFFTDTLGEASEPLLRALDQISAQLGLAIERQRVRSRLIYEAFHDPLTTLPNRAKLLEHLQLLLEHSHHRPDSRFAVFYVDLDRFQQVNDSLGHAAGDVLIAEIGRRLANCVRRDDLVARNVSADTTAAGNIAARLGGDEFTLLLENIHETSDAMRVAQRIQWALAAPFIFANQTLYLSASIGIVQYAPHYADAQDLVRDAAIAMYRAKARGRSRFELFDERMGVHARASLRQEAELHQAIERHELRLLYQPILSVDDKIVRGFEALLRWQHPVRGLIAPDEFLVTAEETGLIHPMGHWVLHEACRQGALWQEAFPADPPLMMCVNASASQINEPNFANHVRQILAATGFPATSLVLELTESVAVADLDQAQKMLLELKALGVRLSLDDFGTGYASLSYLRRLPIDVLKVDRSFVSALDSNAANQHVVETIAALARAFHLHIVAEGPETAEEFAYVRRLGCHYAQGFYLYHPMDVAAANTLLREQAEGMATPAAGAVGA